MLSVRCNTRRVSKRKQLDENTRKLDDPVPRSPSGGMSIARSDRKAEAAIEFGRRVEIADRVNDVIDTTGQYRVFLITCCVNEGGRDQPSHDDRNKPANWASH